MVLDDLRTEDFDGADPAESQNAYSKVLGCGFGCLVNF
jgi:hypothetical protein